MGRRPPGAATAPPTRARPRGWALRAEEKWWAQHSCGIRTHLRSHGGTELIKQARIAFTPRFRPPPSSGHTFCRAQITEHRLTSVPISLLSFITDFLSSENTANDVVPYFCTFTLDHLETCRNTHEHIKATSENTVWAATISDEPPSRSGSSPRL